jgi:tRNA pseudouridine32 synthase/23S rRNA pseudouridine746 synthase
MDWPLIVDWPQRPRQKVDHSHGKPSQTRWRAVRTHPLGHLLDVQPLTGRTHQIRVHLATAGLPILGDTLYAPADVAARSPRLLLHAQGLRFVHPLLGTECHFACDPEFP